jgi:hypothetical protein
MITKGTAVATLTLPATSAMPRELSLNLGLLTGQLIVLQVVSGKVISSAGGVTYSIEKTGIGEALFICGARYHLTPEEVPQVRELLALSPTADSTPSEPAKVVEAAVTPLDGEPGAKPSSVVDGGALGVASSCPRGPDYENPNHHSIPEEWAEWRKQHPAATGCQWANGDWSSWKQ